VGRGDVDIEGGSHRCEEVMPRYKMQDDSVTVPGFGNPEYSGKSITRRGEDVR
jgi:hypothetical protein